jgi:muconolactone delta-isomerase
MKFLIELDHPKTGQLLSDDAARTFIEEVIFPTLARAEKLFADGHILAGGPVAGRIALRFIVDVDSALQLDQLVTSLPLWAIAETRVTALIEFGDRRGHVKALLQLKAQPQRLAAETAAATAQSQ